MEVARKSAHFFHSDTHSFQYFLAPAIASAEANRIQTLETLLDEYRQLVSTGDSTERKESQEAAAQLNEEKNRLLQQIKELNETINSLKFQLEQLSSKVILNHCFSQTVRLDILCPIHQSLSHGYYFFCYYFKESYEFR